MRKTVRGYVFGFLSAVLIVGSVGYAVGFEDKVFEIERTYYSDVENSGDFKLKMNVPHELYGYIGQCDADFDNDGHSERLYISYRNENDYPTIYAEIFESDSYSSWKVCEVSLTTLSSSPFIEDIDVAYVNIDGKKVICFEELYTGFMATGKGMDFKSVYYENNQFYDYFDFDYVGSEFDDYDYSYSLNEFKNNGFKINSIKLFDNASREYIAYQINGINICNYNVSYTGDNIGDISRFAVGQTDNLKPFKYTVKSNLNNISSGIKVLFNNRELSFDQKPIIINGRTMVPIRAIFEAMGYSVDWNMDTQTATATKGNNRVVVQIYNSVLSYVMDGISGTYYCDVQPQIISDRILVPIRAIAETAGCDVSWDEQNSIVYIYQ